MAGLKGKKGAPTGAYGSIGVGVLALAFQLLSARLAERLVGIMSPDEFDTLLDGVIADLQPASEADANSQDEADAQAIKIVKEAFVDTSRTFQKKVREQMAAQP